MGNCFLFIIDGLGVGGIKQETTNIFNTYLSIEKKRKVSDKIFTKLFCSLISTSPDIFKIYNIDNFFFTVGKKTPFHNIPDSFLGHSELMGIENKLELAYCNDVKLDNIFKKTTIHNGITVLDDNFYLFDNIDNSIPSIGINLVASTEKVSFTNIVEVAKIIRKKYLGARVLAIGGQPLKTNEIFKNIISGTNFAGVSIPKLNIYNDKYKVVNLVKSQTSFLSKIINKGVGVYSFGKIGDFFNTKNNNKHYNFEKISKSILDLLNEDKKSKLILSTFQEIDLCGHSQDAIKARKFYDKYIKFIKLIMKKMNKDDIIIVTADHGNDPLNGNNLHTLEYLPFIIIHKNNKFNFTEASFNFPSILNQFM